MNINTSVSFSTKDSVLARANRLICSYWLPAGFFIFLSAFFFAPSQHHYKILVVDLLLLPALLTSLAPSTWARVLRHGPVLGLVIAYLLYMAADALVLQTENAVEYVQWGAYILLFLVAVGSRMSIAEQAFRRLLIIGAAMAAGAAVFAVTCDIHSGVFYQHEYRLVGYGALYNPLRSGNLFGAFALIAAWGALCDDAKLIRGLACCSAILGFSATLLTGSRSPLIALFITGLGATLLEPNRTRRLWWIALICVVSGLVTALCWSELSERGTSLRPEIWSYVWKLCLQHPWFGVGLNTPISIPTSVGATFVDDAHNVFLAAFFYGGIVGLLLFSAAFFCSAWLAWRMHRRSSLAALAALLQLYGLLTLQFDGGCLISRPNDFWVLYWLPIALYLRAAVVYKNFAATDYLRHE